MTIENINLLYNFYKNIFLTFDWSLVTGVVSLITLLIVSTCIVWFLLKLALTVSLYNRSKKTLEVKPLKTTEQDAYSTQELFGLIHSIGKQRNFLERIFGVDNSFSFERFFHGNYFDFREHFTRYAIGAFTGANSLGQYY